MAEEAKEVSTKVLVDARQAAEVRRQRHWPEDAADQRTDDLAGLGFMQSSFSASSSSAQLAYLLAEIDWWMPRRTAFHREGRRSSASVRNHRENDPLSCHPRKPTSNVRAAKPAQSPQTATHPPSAPDQPGRRRAKRTANEEQGHEKPVDAAARCRPQQVDRAPAERLVGANADVKQHGAGAEQGERQGLAASRPVIPPRRQARAQRA